MGAIAITCLSLLLLFCSSRGQTGTGENDLITNLPGPNFKVDFKQYSGYLNATDGIHFFYWLVESQSNPSTDPILLWLQGGPGSSSLVGMTLELGPFRMNPDSHTLFENVFAWNKFANVLFLESPSGVGYSYSDDGKNNTNDDETAYHNYHALRDFFYNKFPQYQTRDFYVTGESYAGVYVPTLAKEIIDGIAAKKFPNNFKGIAIGNGILSQSHQYNSVLNLYYYHGIKGADEWNSLLEACCPNNSSDYCDFYSQRDSGSKCGKELSKFLSGPLANDRYNMYQDCYKGSDENDQISGRSRVDFIRDGRAFQSNPVSKAKNYPPGTKDMSHQLNYDSTDSEFGYQCWGNERPYFNDMEVKKALHVAPQILNNTWCSSCDINYHRQYYDMIDHFTYILKNSNIRILLYNGDVDLVCNFLGDQWFVERQVAPENHLKVLKQRTPWIYRNQIAGFVKRFERLDLLTVKGSGHYVPEDRAGPTLQMIVNFVRNTGDYSRPTKIDVSPKPLS